MNKFLLSLIFISSFCKISEAQWVTIPDPNFAAWIDAECPGCMNGNQMDTSCPNLNLLTIGCDNENISSLEGIQYFHSAQFLFCFDNNLTTLPELPNFLEYVICGDNPLTSITSLPDSLYNFSCNNALLTSLPDLPVSLKSLSCNNNNLVSLPDLPMGLTHLKCNGNQLTSLPELPDSLYILTCDNNHQLACLPQIKTIQLFNFDSTSITCLPNYGNIINSDPPVEDIPLCGILNPSDCEVYWNISGRVYFDANSNCLYDNNETVLSGIKVQLWNSANELEQQVFSNNYGQYSFSVDAFGSYTTRIDTVNFPFIVSCPTNGSVIGPEYLFDFYENFGLECNPFDIGTLSIVGGVFFP